MRSIIAIVTTFATVLHLTAGCCLHAAHFDRSVRCSHESHAACDAEACDVEHNHDDDAAIENAGSDFRDMDRAVEARTAAHCCDGCDCAATIEDEETPVLNWMPTLPCPLVVLDAAVVVMRQASCGACMATPPPTLSELLPPLFERLIV
jgi:hypothetical protein